MDFFWFLSHQSLAFDLIFQNLPKKPLQLIVALEAFERKQVASKVPIRKKVEILQFLAKYGLPYVKKSSGMWHSPSAIISEASVLKNWEIYWFFLHLPIGILRFNNMVNFKWWKSPISILGRPKTPQKLCFENLD